jgi:hypothetical protein
MTGSGSDFAIFCWVVFMVVGVVACIVERIIEG